MRKILLLLSVFLTLVSCSVERDENAKESIVLPDLRLSDADFSIKRGDSDIKMHASFLEYYSYDKKAEMEDITFTSADASGSAESASLDTEDMVLTLRGNVMLSDGSMKALIDGVVILDTETSDIEGSGNASIETEEGSFSTSSFYGNLNKKEYNFQSEATGVLRY